jgi:NAD(P)-dependent dehydrogenase (short-subunit alcohol dehydrogenase family)
VVSRWFDGKVALVTGGGSGIGRAAAVALAEAGAAVVVAGRRVEPLRRTVAEVERVGGFGTHMVVDVTVAEQVAGLITAIRDEFGALDVAVNNAGVPSWGTVSETATDAWEEVIGVNLTGLWLCLKHEIGYMRLRRSGVIVNVASRIGIHMREPRQGVYAASKAAVAVLTRTAARECIASGIRINAVSPGPTDTDMAVWAGETAKERDARVRRSVPIGRLATPYEIAAAIRWLASPESAFVVGHDLVVDGGISA